MAHRRTETPRDLEPYTGCPEDAMLGAEPLAIGWLRRGQPFPTGSVPAEFVVRLLAFCQEPHTVCQTAGRRPCPLEPHSVEEPLVGGKAVALGRGEIRVIGDEEIYAAPTLIYHFVTAHGYQPPLEFVEAVLHGPQPGSAEHRALVRALRTS